MSEPVYPEYIPLEDEHILLAEEQPLPPVVSPSAESPRYVAESDPKEDPEEYKVDEAEDGPVDYPMDGGDDGDDDDDGDSSGYDADDEDEDDEEEHLALADSAIIIPTDELDRALRGVEGDTWIDLAVAVPEMAPTTLEKVNTIVKALAELHEHDTQDLYALLEDAQDGRTRISQRVAMDSQRVDLLMGDRMTLQETVWIIE
nr:hypothetical protein [Tanacetum cinerariifolium]